MEVLEKVRLNLRRTSNALDEDIREDIAAAYEDLKRVGVNIDDPEKPLIIKAVKLYCRWQDNFAGMGDRYQAAYEKLRDAMSISLDYKEVRQDV